jgi:hypothetical protein
LNKAELFYTIDEYTDTTKYCRSKGLRPYKIIEKTLDSKPLPVAVEYIKGNSIYVALSMSQCYSGYSITLMKLPELPFETLLNVSLSTKRAADRAGALGIILKKYTVAFEKFLCDAAHNEHWDLEKKRQLALVATFICDYIRENTSYIWHMNKTLQLCEEIKSKYSNVLPRSKWIRLFRYGI